MKIALAQMDVQWENKQANLEKAEAFIKDAAGARCDVVVFPEMFNTGFSMNVTKIVEDEDGETHRFCSNAASDYSINIIAGYAVKKQRKKMPENIAAVYDRDGKLMTSYSKIHPFKYGKENRYFGSGKKTVTFKLDDVPSSIFICYDLRFPEVFREVADSVYVVFVIANWPDERIHHWETLIRARAIENQFYVAGVNRSGAEKDIGYHGHSIVFDPMGKCLCTGDKREELLSAEISPDEVIRVRKEFPFLKDRKK